MSDTPDPDEALAAAIRDWWNAKAQEDGTPTLLRSWTLVGEGIYVDSDGDDCTRVRSRTNGSVVQQLGLLDYARNLLTMRVFGRAGS